MQEQFVIKNTDDTDIDSTMSTLALILGNDYLAYAVHNDNNELAVLKRCWFAQPADTALQTVLQTDKVLHSVFKKIITAFDYEAYTLLPAAMNNGDHTPLLYLNEANLQDHIISEVITGRQLANIYAVPHQLLNSVLTYFPSSKFWHLQSVHIKNAPKDVGHGSLDVDFGNQFFFVTATHEDAILLSKRYDYQSPADVLFYLLKICEAYHLSQEQVHLNLSGLIDENSDMYRTLYEYFLEISFRLPSWVHGNTYPSHYFTVLNYVALCES